jgi:DNA-binding transcriptional regulator YiaG
MRGNFIELPAPISDHYSAFAQQKQISVATLHRWRKKYGQMDEAEGKRLKALEKEPSGVR